ncbi:GNAT family N-acetyltransferase [Kribbella italica]|uniref:GNAT superfamily N-acetyltransferase n=1 Tax=Kribbella italica TaxID=1540520 RepID=A0A7W9MWV5_9ACTN|nr:GNAT superfamily N-acetyltransferase [Kribbella italica]
MTELQVLTPDDWKAWRELRLAALSEAPAAFGSRYEDWVDAEEDRWRARLSVPGSYCVIVSLDGVPSGMAGGMPADEDEVRHLVSMWVSPAARGHGLGDRLMGAVENWARAEGAHAVELSVVQGNDNAHALYLRHGYALTDKPGDLMPDGIHRELVLRKTL